MNQSHCLCWCLMLAGACPAVLLDTHPVALDARGRLLSWVQPQDRAYDHVMRLSWSLLLDQPAKDPEHGLPLVYTHSEYTPGPVGPSARQWPNHPAGKHALLADSALLFYAYSGDQRVLELVRGLLDHQLAPGTTPADFAWPNVPWSTARAGSREYGNDDRCEGVGFLEPDKVAELGYWGYLRFYEATHATHYRDAAIACADALVTHLRPADERRSPWPFSVDARTGRRITQDYTGHVVAAIQLFDELIRLRLGQVERYREARARVRSWLVAYPLRNHRWHNYFEDVGAGSSSNSQYPAGQTARWLLENPERDPQWRAHAEGLIAWIAEAFGGPDNGEPGWQWGARVIAEQEAYRFKMASHTGRWAALNAMLAERTGDAEAKERAWRALNWCTYMARDNGVVIEGPAEFRENPNCWFSDGHGDYVRHFLVALGACPEWAPRDENHLLRASSVVREVRYEAEALSWETFDPEATAVLRLASQPLTVTAGGVALPRREDLRLPGWTWDTATGVVRVRHVTGGRLRLTHTPLPPRAGVAQPARPVIVGRHSEGTLTDPLWNKGDYLNASRFTAEADLLATRVLAKVVAAPGRYGCALYAVEGGKLLGTTQPLRQSESGWLQFLLATPVNLRRGQQYWLAVWSDDQHARVFADRGGETRWVRRDFGAWPDPLTMPEGTDMTYCVFAAADQLPPMRSAARPALTVTIDPSRPGQPGAAPPPALRHHVRPGARSVAVSEAGRALGLLAFQDPTDEQFTILGDYLQPAPLVLSVRILGEPETARLHLIHTPRGQEPVDGPWFPVVEGTFDATVPAACQFALVGTWRSGRP